MQSANRVTASQLRSLEGPHLRWQGGSESAFATSIGTPASLSSSQLAFVSDINFLSTALQKASLVIVEDKILPATLDLQPHQALWSTPGLKWGMIRVLPLFDPRAASTAPLLSPAATIHPTAQIGARTRIAAGVRIGARVRIGEDCLIQANTVIEDDCQIGNRCHIHPMVIIGADGFGFATDAQNHHHKVPQIGIVVIEDDVEIGSLSTIDRATIGETRIGRGTKMDKHCHVAHNCRIGTDGLFAANFQIAGSVTIGNGCMSGGHIIISDHVNVCDRVVLGGRSAVTKDITKPGAYAGYPLEPLRDNLRTVQNLTHLTEMRRRLNQISKRLGLGAESE